MATSKSNSTDLAVVNSEATDETSESPFPVLAISPAQLQEELEETLNGEEIGPASIDKIKIPTGGGAFWTVPSLDDDQTDVRTFQAVILFGHYTRLYWATAFGEGESGPPNCYSPNARIGIGDFGYGSEKNPTGECANCPMSQWETNPKTGKRSQACALNYAMYVLLPGMRFPAQIKLPRTSLNQRDDKGWRAYIQRLANRGLPVYGVVTEIGLRQASVANTTIKYSIATFKQVARLSDEEAARARAYAESLKPHFIPGDADDDEPVEATKAEPETAEKAKGAF